MAGVCDGDFILFLGGVASVRWRGVFPTFVGYCGLQCLPGFRPVEGSWALTDTEACPDDANVL